MACFLDCLVRFELVLLSRLRRVALLKCWHMVSTPAHAHVAQVYLCLAHGKHTRPRASSQHCTHAWHMVSAPAHAHVAQMYLCLADGKHTRSRASSQHCTHAWHMVSARALAQHRTHASQMLRTPTHFWLRAGLSPEKGPIKQGWMDEKCAAPGRESACKCTRRDIYTYVYIYIYIYISMSVCIPHMYIPCFFCTCMS